MARTLIIGGHGKVALLLAPLLTDRGNEVYSVIRNPDQASDVSATGSTAVVADVASLGTDELVELFAGYDQIVWTAGAGGGAKERTYAVDRDAAIRSMDAAARARAKRYVMVSYFGAGPDHGVAPDDDFFAYADAKTAADEHLRSSELSWTILQPSALTLEEATGRIDTDASESLSVSRADVAAVIDAALADDSTVGKTIRFNQGEVPIAEAIG